MFVGSVSCMLLFDACGVTLYSHEVVIAWELFAVTGQLAVDVAADCGMLLLLC